MRRRVAVGKATAAVAAVMLLAGTMPASAETTLVDVPVADAVAAINAACAATQPLAESGMRVSDTEAVVAAYNPVTGVATQTWNGLGEGLVVTGSPVRLYQQMSLYESDFSKRALKKLGSSAKWTVDPTPDQTIADLIPSPGELIRRMLKAPRHAIAPMTQCANTLLENPLGGFVWTQRTDEAGGTTWRILAGADYYGLDPDYENGVLMAVHVTPQGTIERVERGWSSSDGFWSLGQDLRWEYGVQPAITVPAANTTVDRDRFIAARASFIDSDLKAFARAVARKPLEAATDRALRYRVWDNDLPGRFDPMFPNNDKRVRNGVVYWQKDWSTGKVHALRFYRINNGTQVGYKEVANFTP